MEKRGRQRRGGCLSSKLTTTVIDPASDLANLLKAAIPLRAKERADLLYTSSALEKAHQTAAASGTSAAPDASADIDLHYVCFVKAADGQLWELDGRRKGPLVRGPLAADEDVLSPQALSLGVRPFLHREGGKGDGNGSEGGGERAKDEKGDLRFSIVALAPDFTA